MKTAALASLSITLVMLILGTENAIAHCDAMDGPVVQAAQLALRDRDVTPVLKWVNERGEPEIREAFATALKVRALGEDARKLADTHFFETLVRVHRAGEGVAFTGLKPAGGIDPGFVAADKALADGSVEKLSAALGKAVQEGIRKRYADAAERKKHADESVEAGRAYVAAYVEYAHHIEALHGLVNAEGRHNVHRAEHR